ncbi:HNH endonuclease [Metabacillus litoralis]|uniref:HNH nuclease domain-containing protein n=1 Tax=Metabacillus litoralis TaxID=152268 RepID=A0A179SUM7_9BACI|nr:HNH endonuclease [Metabacillus litoralis]OAS85094.1 hypothetical protein A6K24_06175 [Metabacillus litoralis]
MKKYYKKNRIEIDGKIALIYPNGEKDRGNPFIFDVEDVNLLKYFTIHADHNGGYPVTTTYDSESKKTITVRIHRLITGSLCNEYHVDHINGNVKDNRKCNLRICYPDDAPNQANRTQDWVNHEMVNVRKTDDDYFQMTLSNGIYENVKILYKTYKHLLKDYYFLYDIGLDEGIPIILKSHYNHYKKLLEQTEHKTDEYFTYLNSLQYIKEKVEQKKQNEQKIEQIRQEFEAEGKELTSGIYETKEGGIFFLFTDPRKSKDIIAENEGFIFKYIDNYQN